MTLIVHTMLPCLACRWRWPHAPPRRMTFLWRLLYLPLGVVLAGFLYFHASLIVTPQYYVIDGIVVSQSSREVEASYNPDVFTDVRNAQWSRWEGIRHKENLAVWAGNPDVNVKNESAALQYEIRQGEMEGFVSRKKGVASPVLQERTTPVLGMSSNAQGANLSHNTSNRSHSPPSGTLVPFLKNFELDTVRGCGGRFTGYSGRLVLLRDVVLNRSLAMANASGGEDILSVRDRPEEDEVYTYKPGFFSLPCTDVMIKDTFKPDKSPGHMQCWYDALLFDRYPNTVIASRDDDFGLAVQRYEYANLYWTLLDIYDAFLTLTHFGQTPMNAHIVLMDAKPWSHMDSLWTAFFGRVTRLAQLPNAVRFTKLAWNFQRIHSPVLRHRPLPLHANFRTQMLTAFKLSEPIESPGGRYGKNCSAVGKRRLNILLVWRRDYVAHPRNPAGVVSRKIANEHELLDATKSAFPDCNVHGVQLDKMSMHEQITIISGTDVMIGMHGAAFAFSWFLPAGSGAIELFQANAGSNWHMRHIAESNGIHYAQWKNKNPHNELWHSKSTIIDPDYAIQEIRDMIDRICFREARVKKLKSNKPLPHRTHKQEKKHKLTRLATARNVYAGSKDQLKPILNQIQKTNLKIVQAIEKLKKVHVQ